MKYFVLCAALLAGAVVSADEGEGDMASLSGLSCPMAGYMYPDAENLCFVWFCEYPGEPPIKRMCPKGVRVPSWWEGGELNMCNIVNILKHGGEPTCLRCAANDEKPDIHCSDNPCDDECECEDTEYTYRCRCPETMGVFGGYGSVPAPYDHCQTNPCENGASCQNQWDGFFCFCPNGWTGHRCETSVCDWHPCYNGDCVIDEVGYHCECDECWTGSCCNMTIPGCGEDCGPCRTGYNCETEIISCGCNYQQDNCGLGICVDGPSGPICDDCPNCMGGYNCQAKIDSCVCNDNCPENSRCEDLVDKESHECICDDCYEGDKCQYKVESCECGFECEEGETCAMEYGKPVCKCDSCDCYDKCSPGQTCVDGADGPQCTCPPCYQGPNCEELIYSCGCADPCVRGVCKDYPTGPQCDDCGDCYTGERCDVPVMSCDCHKCEDYEVCSMDGEKPVCGCPPCYTGDKCDQLVDSCECNNPCEEAANCRDGENGAECICDCVQDEICVDEVCVCDDCRYNYPGERGCQQVYKNLCECEDPCTEDQQICIDGEDPTKPPICEIGNPSSGNAFTVMFEENDTEKSIRQIPLELYLTPAVPNSGPRRVNIKSAGLPQDHHCYFSEDITIEENSVHRFPVQRCMMHNKTGIENLAIKAVELDNKAMIMYGINKDRWTADGFLAIPDTQGGTYYQTASYAPAHIATQFGIVALRDNTEVTMTLADDNDLPAPYNTKGSTMKITMDAFQTFQVQASCPDAVKNTKKRQCAKDLTGSVIRSTKPIHVFAGNVRAFIVAGEGLSRDHLVESMLPVQTWGKYFGFVSVPKRAVGDVLNIMAMQGQQTQVTLLYDGKQEIISLPTSEGRANVYKEIPSGMRFIVESDQPISVTQLTKSKDTYKYQNETVHDPVSITIPSTQQFTNNFFFSSPFYSGGAMHDPRPYQKTLALLVARKGEEQYITIDGQPLSSFEMPWGDMPQANGDALVGCVVKLEHGTRLIRNTQGFNFQAVVYAFDDRESIGFPIAMDFKTDDYDASSP